MMTNQKLFAFLATALFSSSVNAFVNTPSNSQRSYNTELLMSNDVLGNKNDAVMQRRAALGSVFGIALSVASIGQSNALDMEAFINSEVSFHTFT